MHARRHSKALATCLCFISAKQQEERYLCHVVPERPQEGAGSRVPLSLLLCLAKRSRAIAGLYTCVHMSTRWWTCAGLWLRSCILEGVGGQHMRPPGSGRTIMRAMRPALRWCVGCSAEIPGCAATLPLQRHRIPHLPHSREEESRVEANEARHFVVMRKRSRVKRRSQEW